MARKLVKNCFLFLALALGGLAKLDMSLAQLSPSLFIALVRSGMSPSLVVQQIDDVVACGPPDGKLVERINKEYTEGCK